MEQLKNCLSYTQLKMLIYMTIFAVKTSWISRFTFLDPSLAIESENSVIVFQWMKVSNVKLPSKS